MQKSSLMLPVFLELLQNQLSCLISEACAYQPADPPMAAFGTRMSTKTGEILKPRHISAAIHGNQLGRVIFRCLILPVRVMDFLVPFGKPVGKAIPASLHILVSEFASAHSYLSFQA